MHPMAKNTCNPYMHHDPKTDRKRWEIETDQISRWAQSIPAEEVGVPEAEDTVGEGELDAEVDDESVQLPEFDRSFGVPAACHV